MGAWHSLEDADLIIEEYTQCRHVAPRWKLTAWSNVGEKNSEYWFGKSRNCVIPPHLYENNTGWLW